MRTENNLLFIENIELIQCKPFEYSFIDIINKWSDTNIDNYDVKIYKPVSVDFNKNTCTLSGNIIFAITDKIEILFKHKLSDLNIDIVINYNVIPLLIIDSQTLTINYIENKKNITPLGIKTADDSPIIIRPLDPLPNWMFINENNELVGFYNNELISEISGEYTFEILTDYYINDNELFKKYITVVYTVTPAVIINWDNLYTHIYFENDVPVFITLEYMTYKDSITCNISVPEETPYLKFEVISKKMFKVIFKQNSGGKILISDIGLLYYDTDDIDKITYLKTIKFQCLIKPKLYYTDNIELSGVLNTEITPIILDAYLTDASQVIYKLISDEYLPSGLILVNNEIHGIPIDIYPKQTKIGVYSTDNQEISGIITIHNKINIEFNQNYDLPYINGIGVLSYNIETYQIEPSEFYVPLVPNLVSSQVDVAFEGFGWLYGVEDVLADIFMQWTAENSLINNFVLSDENNNLYSTTVDNLFVESEYTRCIWFIIWKY